MVEESRARPPNSTKVFVGNISATCSADDLHGLFATFGRVLDCDKVKGELEIQRDRSSATLTHPKKTERLLPIPVKTVACSPDDNIFCYRRSEIKLSDTFDVLLCFSDVAFEGHAR